MGSEPLNVDLEENLSLQNQLMVARITIDGLKKNINDYVEEVMRLQSKLSLVKTHVGAIDTQLRHAERKAYEAGFEDCKLLVAQTLMDASVRLLRVVVIAQAIASLQASRMS